MHFVQSPRVRPRTRALLPNSVLHCLQRSALSLWHMLPRARLLLLNADLYQHDNLSWFKLV